MCLSIIIIINSKKLNNEIIIQYLTDATVVCNESFVVGVSMLSDVMSKSEIAQARWSFRVKK
jgi:hypothetical protein